MREGLEECIEFSFVTSLFFPYVAFEVETLRYLFGVFGWFILFLFIYIYFFLNVKARAFLA